MGKNVARFLAIFGHKYEFFPKIPDFYLFKHNHFFGIFYPLPLRNQP